MVWLRGWLGLVVFAPMCCLPWIHDHTLADEVGIWIRIEDVRRKILWRRASQTLMQNGPLDFRSKLVLFDFLYVIG